MNQNKPEIPNNDINTALDSIPVIEGNWGSQSEEVKRIVREYLSNPIVIEERFRDRETGEVGDYRLRMALSLRHPLLEESLGISTSGIDGDVLGRVKRSSLIRGVIETPHYPTDIVVSLIGRLDDIRNSENPPERDQPFLRDIETYFSTSVEES